MSTEMQAALEALTARVATLEAEIGACKNVQSVRLGQRERARVAENVRKRLEFFGATPTEQARTVLAWSRDELREFLKASSWDELLRTARGLEGPARAAVLEAIALDHTPIRQRLEIFLRPAPRVVKLAPRPDASGRKVSGTIHYGHKQEYLCSLDVGWTGLDADWQQIVKEDAAAYNRIGELMALGFLEVQHLEEDDARRWAWDNR